MSRRICLLLGLAFALFANVGCCAWADRWCGNRNPPVAYAPAPAVCCPPPQPYCPPPQQGYQRQYQYCP